MGHWSDRYVGRPYGEGFDCAELARLVNREVFGRDILLPASRWHAGLTGAARLRAMRRQIAACTDDCARRTEAPAEGDGVLILARGRPTHIGLYCLIAGVPWVLHAAQGPGQVVRTRLRDMARLGWPVEGYYQWL